MEFATGALGTLLPKLGQLLQDEYSLHKGAKNNIQFLKEELESIEPALCKVGNTPLDELDEQVRIWARQAREVSYHMEGIVDTFLVRVQGPKRPSKRSAKRFIKKMLDTVSKAKIRHDIGQEMNDIKKSVKEIAERRDRYKIDAITPAKTKEVDPRILSLYTNVADLVGIDGSREELIRKLKKEDDTSVQRQRIVSVFGFGGLGKTTLARAVHDKLKWKFNCTAFVSIGRNPDIGNVLREILIKLDEQQSKDFNLTIFNETQLIDKIRSFLENKRYFIVIDDVWDKNSWEIIRLAFDEKNSESRVILTTRKLKVAEQADEVYNLKPLSDENSRKLFFARIFGGESNSSCHQAYDEVSDRILKKCQGVPLAIITMASLLADKPWGEWSEVHRSIVFSNKENQQVGNTMKIISFSYYDLPSDLRTCLLYLSVFPEDHFIDKGSLIWMWIAEGFVQKKNQGMSSFEIGEGYFNELVNRSMIQLVEEWDEGNRKLVHGCQVHDMVLDLICSISMEENFVTTLNNNNEGASSSQGKVRRLALQNNRTGEVRMENMQEVRSFISFGCDIDKGVPSFKLQRVVAIYSNFQRFDRCYLKHLRSLLHLRYLRLSGFYNVELPEEIGTLKFLQTLHVDALRNTEVVILLTQLRCLRLDLGNGVAIFPDGTRKLTFLEELEVCFSWSRDVGNEPMRRFVKELGSLMELRVLRLDICGPLPTDLQIDLAESLRNLRKMEQLSLTASASADTATWEAAGFRLPRQLRHLLLNFISFSRFPSFFINRSSLPYLSHLSLSVDAIDEQELEILGQLPELRFLDLVVKATTEMVCNATTDIAGDGGCFFKKLRHCTMNPSDVLLLAGKDDSCGVSFRMRRVHATALLGSEWEGVSSGKGLMPTLMPRVRKLCFDVASVREFKVENHGVSLCLEYFASLQNISVRIYCDVGESDSELEEVEAALHRAAGVHPNHPTLDTSWHSTPAHLLERERMMLRQADSPSDHAT